METRLVLAVVLGTGTGALLGNDLTDPENNGLDNANGGAGANFNWITTRASSENNFSPGGASNEGALDVFDNKLGPGEAKWCCNGAPQWLEVQLDRPYALTHFTLSSANDVPGRDPDVWEIQGSNNGANWQTIYRYSRDGISPFSDRLQVVRFDGGGADFPTPAPYSWFRYQVTSQVSGGSHQIGEWELFGVGGLAVLNVSPADGEVVFPSPQTARLDFSQDVDPTSVQASDLMIDGSAAAGFTIIDGNTIEFELPALAAGAHALSMLEGVLDPLDPVDALAAFQSTFIVPGPVTLENLPATDVLAHSAEVSVRVISTGGDDPDLFLYWGESDGGADANSWDHVVPLGSGGIGSYAAGLSDLRENTTYYFRGRATNLAEDVWADTSSSFSTVPLSLPEVEIQPVTTVGAFAAEIHGQVTQSGGDFPNISIYYGQADGGDDKSAWDHAVELGETASSFIAGIGDLAADTPYYVRILATNEVGESWSADTETFLTSPAPQIRLSEFLASNSSGLATRVRASSQVPYTGASFQPDWIELENISAEPAELGGVHLTDDAGNPFLWSFPIGTTIPAHDFLVVFASGRDILDTALDERGILHTNFGLSSDGEYLALTAGDGAVLDEVAPQFPPQVVDVSYGLFQQQMAYLGAVTPGAANAGSVTEFVADTRFSVDRGFYQEPFVLEIRSDTPDAQIRYTTNGNTPTEFAGFPYTGPITVDRTTTIRAIAYKPGLRSTNVDTHTYIFVDDVVGQTYQSTLSAGFPSSWNGNSPDYGLDSRIVGPGDRFGGKYVASIRDDLQSIPTLSIVASLSSLFGSSGIYTNPTNSNLEVPTSFELIHPDGTRGFQIDAGLKIQGGAFRGFGLTPKKSFRLKFKSEYGAGKLNYPLFGTDAVDEFDTITLRMEANDGWQWTTSTNRVYARDEFGRRTQLAMGQPSPHGARMHLYLNGVYWGVYNPVERPDETFASPYIGGEKEEWDVQNSGNAINGDLSSWNTLVGLAGAVSREVAGSPEQLAAWERMNGNFPDGEDDPGQEDYLDVENYIDYMIVNFYGGNSDWPHKNYYAGRRRGPESTGFQFFMWDSEWSLNLQSNVSTDRTSQSSGIAAPYASLKSVPEFRMQFADRVQQHFFHGGALYVDPSNPSWDPAHPERNVPAARFAEIADPLGSPLVAESARWGDQHGALLTVDESWRPVVDNLLSSYFPSRSANVLQHFVAAGLFPDLAAPLFNQRGGEVSSGFDIALSAAEGTIYYTLDGSDPRLTGGNIDPAAIEYSGPFNLAESAAVRVRALEGETWSALDEADFIVDAVAAGADNLRITEINYNPPDALLQFGEDNFGSSEFEFIELRNVGAQTIDLRDVRLAEALIDGNSEGVRFTFLPQRLEPGQRVSVVANREAFQSRYAQDVLLALGDAGNGSVDGQYEGRLSNSGEWLTLLDRNGDIIQQFEYNDSGSWPGRADGNGSSLEVLDVNADYNDPNNWRSSQDFGGSPSAAGSEPSQSILINEVLTHTDLPAVDFIELFNASDSAVDVSRWYLSDDNDNYFKFSIPAGAAIPPQGYLTFTEADFNSGDPLNGFALDGARGEDLWLLSASADGSPLRFIDRVEFGAAANGESWGRWPNGQGDLYPSTEVTLNGPNAAPRVGPVVISEIMYNPPNPDGPGGIDADDLEFVEIFNPTSQAVPLDHWRLTDAIEFEFPAGLMLQSQATIVVVAFDPNDPLNSRRTEDFRHLYAIPDSVLLVGGYARKLGDEGDEVRLLRPDEPPLEEPDLIPGLLEDAARYDDVLPWPLEPDGSGASLHRLGQALWGNDPASWRGAAPSPGFVDLAIDLQPPTFERVAVNRYLADPADLLVGPQPSSWSLQRSELRRIEIVFSEFVQAAFTDFRLINLGVDADNDPDQEVALTEDHFHLQGAIVSLEFGLGELADGVYSVEVAATVSDMQGNPFDGNADGTGGDIYTAYGDETNGMYSLTSDWNGDEGTTIFDFATFAYWFGQATPTAPEYVDLDGDGGVSIFDFPAFAGAFGTGIRFPNAAAPGALRPEPSQAWGLAPHRATGGNRTNKSLESDHDHSRLLRRFAADEAFLHPIAQLADRLEFEPSRPLRQQRDDVALDELLGRADDWHDLLA